VNFNCLPTAISSLPHKEVDRACKIVLDYLPEIPVWPQLPAVGFMENMYVQYSEKLPCLVVDGQKKKIYFKTAGDITAALEKFYEKVIADDFEYFKISHTYSAGFYGFISAIKSLDKQRLDGIRYIKGQITGPISFGLTVTDENNRAIFYNEQFTDVIVNNCIMKAKWQIKKLREIHGPINIIIFIDEPYMASFGSSFVALNKGDVSNCLRKVVDAIRSESAIAGIHCCGNTDWTVLIDSGVDIISFDAYNYVESVSLYPARLKNFLNEGKVLAWGIIPSSAEVVQETKESLVERFNKGIGLFTAKGFDRNQLFSQCLITPSCGAGSLSVDNAEKVLKLNKEVSGELRKSFKL